MILVLEMLLTLLKLLLLDPKILSFGALHVLVVHNVSCITFTKLLTAETWVLSIAYVDIVNCTINSNLHSLRLPSMP